MRLSPSRSSGAGALTFIGLSLLLASCGSSVSAPAQEGSAEDAPAAAATGSTSKPVDWMLNAAGPDARLASVAIPGSHDSGTSQLSTRPISPQRFGSCGLDGMSITNIYTLGLVGEQMQKWGKAQDASIEEQLNMGIRHFDLRVANDGGEARIAHGTYSKYGLGEHMAKVRSFLDRGSTDPVLMDIVLCDERAVDDFIDVMEEHICDRTRDLHGYSSSAMTLGQAAGHALVFLDAPSEAMYALERRIPRCFVNSDEWRQNAYPNQTRPCDGWAAEMRKARAFLVNAVDNRDGNRLQSIQYQFTPDETAIANGLGIHTWISGCPGDLWEYERDILTPEFTRSLLEAADLHSLNIVDTDFVRPWFVTEVGKLNWQKFPR